MRSQWISILCIWTAVSSVGPMVQAVESKNFVPESTSVVVRWKAPQVSIKKLGDFVDAVQPGFGNVVKTALPQLGSVIGNPGMQGVDIDQDIWAIAFLESKSAPAAVFVVTATSADAIKKALPPNFNSYISGNIVAYSDNVDALRKVQELLEGKGKTLWAKIDSVSIKHFEASDLSTIVNIQQLTRSFAEELEQSGPQIDAAIDRIADNSPDGQKQQLAMMLDVYRQLGKSLVAVVRDSNSWTMGFTFSQDTIRFSDRWQVASDTPTAKFLANQPASNLSLANRLPAGKAVYFDVNFNSADFIQWSMEIGRKMMMSATPEKLAQYDAMAKEMSQLKFGEIAMYLDIDSKSPAYRVGGVTMLDQPDMMRKMSQAFIQSMGEIKLPNLTQTQKMETDFAKIGADRVDRVTIKQELDADSDPSGFAKKLQSIIFGEEGMQQFILYRRDRMLNALGSIEDLKQLVASIDTISESRSAVAVARKRFPDKAHVVAFVDAARLTVRGLELAGEQGLLPFRTAAFRDLKINPSFLGYSLTLEPTASQSQLEVPVELVQNLIKIFNTAQQQR